MPVSTLSFKRQPSQQGFSLIEILVAFMILAIALTVIFRIFSGGLRNISLAEDYARAEMIAESHLSIVGVSTPLQIGITSGEWGERFRWESVIEHYQPWQQDKTLISPVTAYQVTVNVYWQHTGGNSQISLSSLRLQHSPGIPGQG